MARKKPPAARRFILTSEIAALVGLTRQAVGGWCRNPPPGFPPPLDLPGRWLRWSRPAVMAWLKGFRRRAADVA